MITTSAAMMTNSSLTQHTQQLTDDMVEMAQVSCNCLS